MAFNKTFFQKLSDSVKEYLKIFPCPGGSVTVTLKACGANYNLYRILYADDTVVTFTYYGKAVELAEEKSPDEPVAWPALTVPYEVIESVEFNPAPPDPKWKQTISKWCPKVPWDKFPHFLAQLFRWLTNTNANH